MNLLTKTKTIFCLFIDARGNGRTTRSDVTIYRTEDQSVKQLLKREFNL